MGNIQKKKEKKQQKPGVRVAAYTQGKNDLCKLPFELENFENS